MSKPDKSLFACPLPKVRERSRLNERDCLEAVSEFFRKVERLGHTSEGFEGGASFAPDGSILVKFLVKGNFGVADDLFEAGRVISGYKLPRNDSA